MLFALVLHKLIHSIEADDGCIDISLEAWYLDDGVIAGNRQAVIRALGLIEELGPHLDYKSISRNGNFSAEMGIPFFPPQ